jgi:hypothetical protein
MSYQIGTATDYSDLLNQLDTFLTSQGMTLTPAYTGTGNGTISALIGGSASVAEVVTITFTDATHFSVVGSTSGAIGTGVVGTAFVSTKINFMITAGGTAFVATDAFTVSTTPPWTSLRRNAGDQMVWQAPGNGNLDAIIVGAQLFSNVGADYYNWRLLGATAFDSSLTFDNQAGYVGGAGQSAPSPVLTLWNSSTPYWFIANGRRVIVIAKISTVYVVAYLGFMNTYPSPGVFPYPVVVAGSMAWDGGYLSVEPLASSNNWRWSYSGNELRNLGIGLPPKSYDSGCQLRLRLPTGVWRGFDSGFAEGALGRLWPYTDANQGGMQDWRADLDGGYTILPLVLYDSAVQNIYGELDGVGATTGFEQSSENTITIAGVSWLVVQNVDRTTKVDYFAVKLS